MSNQRRPTESAAEPTPRRATQGSRTRCAIELEANLNEVSHNRLSRNGNGIGIAGNRNVIRGNRVDRSRGREGGFAIPLEHGDHNLIAHNSIRGTGAAGISVGFEPGADNLVVRNQIRGAGEAGVLVDSRGRRTVLVGNVIRGAGDDGVLVKSKARRTVLRGNHSFGANDDGIDVDSPTTKLTRNTAERNADFGIEAVPGIIDLGDNTASGNGNPLQCLNVVCR
jgi:hypothetical protein